jgi:hypothetical protein
VLCNYCYTEASEGLSKSFHGAVIADAVVYSRSTTKDVLRQLRTHLFSHTLRIPAGCSRANNGHQQDQHQKSKGYVPYTQVNGLPQGSVLSSLLCNIYFGYAERCLFLDDDATARKLGVSTPTAATQTPSDVGMDVTPARTCVIRMIDDYFIASTSRYQHVSSFYRLMCLVISMTANPRTRNPRSAIVDFLQRIHTRLEAFGGIVNPLKTRINFSCELELHGARVSLQPNLCGEGDDYLHWCGFAINCSTLQVYFSETVKGMR